MWEVKAWYYDSRWTLACFQDKLFFIGPNYLSEPMFCPYEPEFLHLHPSNIVYWSQSMSCKWFTKFQFKSCLKISQSPPWLISTSVISDFSKIYFKFSTAISVADLLPIVGKCWTVVFFVSNLLINRWNALMWGARPGKFQARRPSHCKMFFDLTD